MVNLALTIDYYKDWKKVQEIIQLSAGGNAEEIILVVFV